MKMSMVTYEIPKNRRHDPCQGEGTPTIHKKVKIGRKWGREFIFTVGESCPRPSLRTRDLKLELELELYFYLNTVNLSDKIIIILITIYFNLYKHAQKIFKRENRENKEILLYIDAVCV